MPGFNSPHKACIRERFDKTLIHFLKDSYGCRIIYYGLPSPEAADIICWKDYIDYVIAFQCRDYPYLSSPDQSTESIDELYQRLSELEASNVIEGFDLYDGYMEEVLFRGIDNSASGAMKYRHDDFVTLFNLDFCNKITSPQEYVDIEGNTVSKYKFELIDKILEYQASVTNEDDKFVLFLTLKCSFSDDELVAYKSANNAELNRYYHSGQSRGVKKRYILKHYVESSLAEKILSRDYVYYYLPTIFYRGNSDIEMMHLAVLCIRPSEAKKQDGVFPVTQSIGEVTTRMPIMPNENCDGFILYEPTIPGMNSPDLNWINAFINSDIYNCYWKQE